MSQLEAAVETSGSRTHELSWLRDGCLTLGLFLLLAEWLRPLVRIAEFADFYRVQPFLAAAGCFLLIDYLRIRSWANGLMKLLLCLALTGYMFRRGEGLEWAWWSGYGRILWKDGANLANGQWGSVSAENRMLLFLIGCALILSVVRALLMQKQRGLWLVLLTLAYLIGLQLWPGVDTQHGLVRTLAVGALFQSLLCLPRLERKYLFSASGTGWPWTWLAASVLIVGAGVALALYASRSESTRI